MSTTASDRAVSTRFIRHFEQAKEQQRYARQQWSRWSCIGHCAHRTRHLYDGRCGRQWDDVDMHIPQASSKSQEHSSLQILSSFRFLSLISSRKICSKTTGAERQWPCSARIRNVVSVLKSPDPTKAIIQWMNRSTHIVSCSSHSSLYCGRCPSRASSQQSAETAQQHGHIQYSLDHVAILCPRGTWNLNDERLFDWARSSQCRVLDQRWVECRGWTYQTRSISLHQISITYCRADHISW